MAAGAWYSRRQARFVAFSKRWGLVRARVKAKTEASSRFFWFRLQVVKALREVLYTKIILLNYALGVLSKDERERKIRNRGQSLCFCFSKIYAYKNKPRPRLRFLGYEAR